ncbi:MAG: hypothetical protein GX878_02290 [Firmicutes bacterium]|nr:hypothetical protein [Bacillota bacterium]
MATALAAVRIRILEQPICSLVDPLHGELVIVAHLAAQVTHLFANLDTVAAHIEPEDPGAAAAGKY